MRSQWCRLSLLAAPALALTFLTTFPTAVSAELASFGSVLSRGAPPLDIARRDDDHDHHNPHAAPLLVLNETQVTLHHAPTPPSYYTNDWEDDSSTPRHPGLMIMHIMLMCSAFFVALPIGIAMRTVNHSWHGFVVFLFYGLNAMGLAASGLYKKLSPNMYEGAAHGKHGWIILLFSVLLSIVDLLALVRRVIIHVKSGEKITLKSFWRTIVLGKEDVDRSGPEYTGLVVDEPEEFEESKVSFNGLPHHRDLERVRTQDSEDDHADTAQWANNSHRHHRDYSVSAGSERTLFGGPRSPSYDDTMHDLKVAVTSKAPLLHRIRRFVFDTSERVLVLAGLAQVITGIVIYTGGCRENYANGCLAHLIKGAIFWCYGLFTFARFLGAFSDLGWAWNRIPSGQYPSAEFVESSLIFIYGITNTWMERFGANPGDPFTTKQVQHIGIAVMFWFAGLVGMGIESKHIRRWLASNATAALDPATLSQEAVAEPPSYGASFNPFPALVIGVTGSAMAAHMQVYLFQVQIHSLWGNLLLAAAVMRCLTYFFLWLAPPRSILPSRPPTEALGSFFLACGGLVFMFSTEEVTIAAMRRGRDDVMMFLCVAVAMTCFACCWTLFVVGFNGWLKSHTHPKVTYHSSA